MLGRLCGPLTWSEGPRGPMVPFTTSVTGSRIKCHDTGSERRMSTHAPTLSGTGLTKKKTKKTAVLFCLLPEKVPMFFFCFCFQMMNSDV